MGKTKQAEDKIFSVALREMIEIANYYSVY